ncbi:Ankyrin-3 [Araneus ventricosus]|uniref:Ankyrin-3 n=1 Tax=Araneus ventricosus TaxID=182803 RepID=A0A4Y2D1D4_ARAVE|nr:Ankyrin-3 [Araneus ventricosus]
MDFSMDSVRTSPLFRLVGSDHNLPEIRQLLARGEDPNRQRYGGSTPLHDALKSPEENIGVVRELINAGANVNLSTHDLGLTPLHIAAMHRKCRAVDVLIESGAFVNAKDIHGNTILHIAITISMVFEPPNIKVLWPDEWIIDKLLTHEDIDLNLVDEKGDTPLMYAIKCQQENIALKLLRNNANPNICNKSSETALHVAFAKNHENSVEIQLLINGASIYSVDKNGQTPLDILLKNGLECRTNEWVMLILKVIAFKYNITEILKQKLEKIPRLSQFFNKCVDEVYQMRTDFISGNLTVHDFCWECFNENDFENILSQIHKPVIDRLIRDVYTEYFIDILNGIPDSSWFAILQMTASSKRRTKDNKVKDLADLFSIMDILILICDYLCCIEIFCLIAAFSDVKFPESMKNVHARSNHMLLNWLIS